MAARRLAGSCFGSGQRVRVRARQRGQRALAYRTRSITRQAVRNSASCVMSSIVTAVQPSVNAFASFAMSATSEVTWAVLLSKTHRCRSGGMLVLVEDAAEAVASSDVEVGYLVRIDDLSWQLVVGSWWSGRAFTMPWCGRCML
jgi:hypothetical protein